MVTKTKSRELPELGLSNSQQEGVVNTLRVVLADEHLLYIKLRKYHWNVSGPQFHALHEMFEAQYSALATAIDEVAERIVQYGAPVPGTLDEFASDTRLNEDPGNVPDAHTMVLNIVADHEMMVRNLRDDVAAVGEEYDDVGSEDFLTGLLQMHQKQAWMLRAMLDGESV